VACAPAQQRRTRGQCTFGCNCLSSLLPSRKQDSDGRGTALPWSSHGRCTVLPRSRHGRRMDASWTEDGPSAVARRIHHGCQRSRHATGASRGLNTNLPLSTFTTWGCPAPRDSGLPTVGRAEAGIAPLCRRNWRRGRRRSEGRVIRVIPDSSSSPPGTYLPRATCSEPPPCKPISWTAGPSSQRRWSRRPAMATRRNPAVHGLGSYPWSGKVEADPVRSLAGATFHQSAPVAWSGG